MSESTSKRRRPDSDRDVDISRPRSPWQGIQSTFNTILWVVVMVSVLALFFVFESSTWTWLALLAGIVLLFGAIIVGLVVVQGGVFSWMRLARKPAMLLAKGHAAGAEAALQKALARANRFAAKDHRRAVMLVELAGYQGNQGRIDAARRMFEEAIEILALDKRTRPMDYFIALNNLAVLFIHVHDYMAAQHLLERALNLTLLARKTSAGDNVVVNAGQLPTMEFVLHMNLACIFIEFHELADAKRHLREASLLFDEVGKAFQKMFHDHFLCLRARWKLEAGRIDDAWKELERAHDLDFSNCVRMRAKLHVACNEYQDALVLLDQAFEQQRRKGSLHHPEMLEACLERATCQFELGKRSDALKSLDEARRIVTDFRLPRRDRWRKNLAPWAARAREIGDSELQRSLDAELQTIPETDAGIVVLERFRRVASDMDPNESEDR